jgi:transcriptional regulator with XRE-family HTH domain
MSVKFSQIGGRLRAYRLGKGYTAAEIAEKIGVSRAAVYRLEKGELVKIETLERLSELLEVSLPSLLGVEVEYYRNAVSFFERMRQLEQTADRVLGNFSPSSLLLFSEQYMDHLRTMLLESPVDGRSERQSYEEYVDRVLELNRERRAAAARRHTPVVSIVGARDIERFLRSGLVGCFDLPAAELEQRRKAARREVEHLVEIVAKPPAGVEIGIVEDTPSAQTFQVFEAQDTTWVTLSPYRLGEHPNVTSGIAMVTSAPEAVRLFRDIITGQWDRAHKDDAAVRVLRDLLEQTDPVLNNRPPRG